MCHHSYLSSQHFYTLAALCDSETASRSKVEGMRSLKVARKMTFGTLGFPTLSLEPGSPRPFTE